MTSCYRLILQQEVSFFTVHFLGYSPITGMGFFYAVHIQALKWVVSFMRTLLKKHAVVAGEKGTQKIWGRNSYFLTSVFSCVNSVFWFLAAIRAFCVLLRPFSPRLDSVPIVYPPSPSWKTRPQNRRPFSGASAQRRNKAPIFSARSRTPHIRGTAFPTGNRPLPKTSGRCPCVATLRKHEKSNVGGDLADRKRHCFLSQATQCLYGIIPILQQPHFTEYWNSSVLTEAAVLQSCKLSLNLMYRNGDE